MEKKFTKDYYKAYISIPVRYLFVLAFCVVGFALTGTYSGEKTRVLAIVLTCFMAGVVLWALIDILTTPKRFLKNLKKLPDNKEDEILSGYEKASKIGNRWFMENYVLYYENRSIRVLSYSEITSVEPKGNKLVLGLGEGEKPAAMPVEPDENPAMLAAALRSKNPNIAAIVNGKVIDIEKEKKEDNV